MQSLWMEVDVEHKELPIRVCSTAQQLAKECGVSPATVFSANYRHVNEGYRSRYIRVDIPDECEYDNGRIYQLEDKS